MEGEFLCLGIDLFPLGRYRMEAVSSEAVSDDDALLVALAQSEEWALDAVIERHGGWLDRLATGTLGDHHQAQEAVQETLVALWSGAGRIRRGTSLRSWLAAVVLNQCRKQQRRSTRWWRRFKAPAAQEPASEVNGEQLDTGPLWRAITTLGEGQREVLILRHIEGLDVRATAEALGLPEGTVKSRCATALRRLRELLPTEPEGHDHG